MVEEIVGKNKFDQYSSYSVTLSPDGNILYYNGQRIKLLVDKISDSYFQTFWVDDAGTVNLSVVRNAAGSITAIESITEEQAQKYKSLTDN